MAHAAIAESVQLEKAAKDLAKAVLEIVNSNHFDPENILQRKLKLSQAYCLMWQDQASGEVDDRMLSYERNAGCVAAILLDLAALGMIEFDVERNAFCGIGYTNIYLKVICDSPTETFLDQALFDKIRMQHHKHKKVRMELHEWIKNDIKKLSLSKKCSTDTFKSLVDIGILAKKKTVIGKTFPTLDPGPEEALVTEIRKLALENKEPDSYMRALMTVMRAVDRLHVLRDPLLRRYFSSDEYKVAKTRIKALFGVGDDGLKI